MSNGVSLVIPTLNAESYIYTLLEIITEQTCVPDEILVVDSSSTDDTVVNVSNFAEKSSANILLKIIDRKDFDHGGTRDKAFREWTHGDLVLFITQDAIPSDKYYIEKIIEPFAKQKVGVVTGRQLPKTDARRFEQLVRQFNYPEKSFIRGKEDLAMYGIKTFFTSDVCSAYRRSAYTECGGFPFPCNQSEDMYMAAKMIAMDWLVAYEANACVYHSHNLTPKQQYERNYAIGYFLEENKDVLMDASEIGEGKRLVAYVTGSLLHEGHLGELCAFGIDCVARLMGNRAGRKQACRSVEIMKHRYFKGDETK